MRRVTVIFFGFFSAVIAATLASSAVVSATHVARLTDPRGRLVQERLPDATMVGILAFVAIIAAVFIGIPVVALLRRCAGMTFRSFVYAGLIGAVPLALLWSVLIYVAVSDHPIPPIGYGYAAALAFAMSFPGCLAYWYATKQV